MKTLTTTGIALLAALCSCSSVRKDTTYTTDRHISTTNSTIISPDTLTVRLAPQSQSVVVHDSLSILANDYARSTVRINHDGTLSHTLSSRDTAIQIPVMRHVYTTDTIVTGHSHTTSSTTPPSFAWIVPTAILTTATIAFLTIAIRH